MHALKNYFLCNHRMNRKPFLLIVLLICLVIEPIERHFVPDIDPKDQHAMFSIYAQKYDGKITQDEYDSQMQMIEKKVRSAWPHTALLIIGFIEGLLIVPAAAMRLKDLNFSPWLSLIYLGHFTLITALGLKMSLVVPILMLFLCFWLSLILIFKLGTKGANRYGPDPLEPQVVK